MDIANSISMAPRMVIFEDIICRNYYGVSHQGPFDGNCKVEGVQSELAFVNGWKGTFDSIPGMLKHDLMHLHRTESSYL